MRIIKFRGKSKLNGEWVYGDLVQCMSDDIKIVNSNRPKDLSYRIIDIQSDTVGQFTGLHDNNGKKIFEGDIVAVYDGDDNKKGQGKVEFLQDGGVWYISAMIDDGLFDVNYNNYIEVIGNAYDNPELLDD